MDQIDAETESYKVPNESASLCDAAHTFSRAWPAAAASLYKMQVQDQLSLSTHTTR